MSESRGEYTATSADRLNPRVTKEFGHIINEESLKLAFSALLKK